LRSSRAVAHSILVAAYQMLKTGETYRQPGPDYFDRLRPQRTIKRLVKRLEQLRYKADLSPLESSQPTATE
jgi:transposase